MGKLGDLKDGDQLIHPHCARGTTYGNLFGGHLFRATVFATTEIMLAKVKNSQIKKKQRTVTGLTEMRTDLWREQIFLGGGNGSLSTLRREPSIPMTMKRSEMKDD